MKVNFTDLNIELNSKGFMDAISIIKNSRSSGHVVVTRQVEGETVAVAAFISTGAQTCTGMIHPKTNPNKAEQVEFVIPAKLTPVAMPPADSIREFTLAGRPETVDVP